MKIFCRYLFIDALLKVTKQIQNATSRKPAEEDVSTLIPLPLKINQYERQHIMNSLNPSCPTYEQGQNVIKSLLIMMDKQIEENKRKGIVSKKTKMTYEEFLDDPFGKKKKQI